MKLTTLTSTAALLVAFAAAPAMADNHAMTIGGNVVSEADLPYVQDRCDALKAEADTALSTQDDGTDTDVPADGNEQDEDADEGDNALTTIDLDTLTVEQCEEGGFYADDM